MKPIDKIQKMFASYVPLAPLYLANNQQLPTDLAGFIVTGFKLAVALAAALAVIRLIYAGIQYMSTDLVFKKGQARTTIEQALLGLLLVMISYLVLRTINPDLVNVDLLTGGQTSGDFSDGGSTSDTGGDFGTVITPTSSNSGSGDVNATITEYNYLSNGKTYVVKTTSTESISSIDITNLYSFSDVSASNVTSPFNNYTQAACTAMRASIKSRYPTDTVGECTKQTSLR